MTTQDDMNMNTNDNEATPQSTGTPGTDQDALTGAIMTLGRGLMRHEHISRRGGRKSARMGQGRVLALLGAKAPMTQRELGFLLDIRPQSLAELLAKLEGKGLITRTRDENDRRTQVIDLTDEGRKAVPDPNAQADAADPFAVLSEDEREQLANSLDAVLKHLIETEGDPRDDRRGHGPHGHGPHGRGGHGPRGRGFGPGEGPGDGPDPREGGFDPREGGPRPGFQTPDGRGAFYQAREGFGPEGPEGREHRGHRKGHGRGRGFGKGGFGREGFGRGDFGSRGFQPGMA